MKKITLKKETIRNLDENELQDVNGGVSDEGCNSNPICPCNTSVLTDGCPPGKTETCPSWITNCIC